MQITPLLRVVVFFRNAASHQHAELPIPMVWSDR
jgi:hypothetical protein